MLLVTMALALRMLSPGCPLLEFLCFHLFLMSSHLAICLYAYGVVCGLETHFGFALVAIMLIIFTVFKKNTSCVTVLYWIIIQLVYFDHLENTVTSCNESNCPAESARCVTGAVG